MPLNKYEFYVTFFNTSLFIFKLSVYLISDITLIKCMSFCCEKTKKGKLSK